MPNQSIGTTRRESASTNRIRDIEQNRGDKRVQKNKRKIVPLHVRQDSDDTTEMPAGGSEFSPTHLVDRNFEIYQAHLFFTAGTFSVRLKIAGVELGPVITNASTNPIDIDPVVVYKDNDPITVAVTSSSGVENFELIFKMLEI